MRCGISHKATDYLNLEVSIRIRKEASGAHNEGCADLLSDLMKLGAAEHINVMVNGKNLGVMYEGPLPATNYLLYPMSNEKIGKRNLEGIDKISGISHFLGIVGGFTSPLAHVALLQQKNSIETCTFVDTDENQCFNAVVMALRLDRHLSRGMDIRAFEPKLFLDRTLFERPLPDRFNFRNEDMMQSVVSASEGGRYFIYLSNAYMLGDYHNIIISTITGDDDIMETADLLKAILENRNMDSGSCVLFAHAWSSEFVMLEKEHDGFSIRDLQCGNRTARKTLEAFLRRI